MTARAGVVAGLALVSAVCAPKPPPAPPAPPPQRTELVALAPDPETGETGRLEISSGTSTVELTTARSSTFVTPTGLAPATSMAAAEFDRVFGPVIKTLPPPAVEFSLFFETGGDTLTAASQRLLPEIVAAARGRAAPRVSVIGHTDPTDVAAANIALGLRRAQAIRTVLLTAGVDASLIEIASHGEADPLVRTPDNTAEPKNRRVEVTVR
jgi:outer membrane protein OmpA-like peptidoglycan-associated protein